MIAFPIALVGVTVGLSGVSEGAHIGQLFLISLLSFGATATVYLLAYLTFLNPSPSRASRPVLALITHLFAQALASLVLLVYLLQAGLIWNPALGRFLIGTFWALVLSMIIQASRQFRRDSRELVAAISAARVEVESFEAQIAQARMALVEKVRGLLAQMLSLRSADQLPEATRAIRPILDTIRDDETLLREPDLGSLRVPASLVFGKAVLAPRAPVSVAMVGIAAGPLATLQNLTLPLVLNYIPLGATILVSLLLARKYSNQKPVVAFVYAIGVSLTLVTANIIGQLFSVESQSLYLANLRTWLVTFAIGLLISYYLEQDRLIEKLEASRKQFEWQVARSRQLLWAESFKLALSVHGDVQSKIIASIARADDLSAIDLEALKRECLDSLDRGLEKSFDQYWEQTLGLWGDGIEFEKHLTDHAAMALSNDRVANAATIEIVREAVLNAVRHGSATKISVAIGLSETSSGSLISIEVRNNGASIEGEPESGFGSELIDKVATSWSLENLEGQVQLTAMLPFQNSENHALQPVNP